MYFDLFIVKTPTMEHPNQGTVLKLRFYGNIHLACRENFASVLNDPFQKTFMIILLLTFMKGARRAILYQFLLQEVLLLCLIQWKSYQSLLQIVQYSSEEGGFCHY